MAVRVGRRSITDGWHTSRAPVRLEAQSLVLTDQPKQSIGYLVCAPKRKPAKFMKPESAVAKAKAAAKATGRSEVFALVPVGVATRKQIQAVEFKERVA